MQSSYTAVAEVLGSATVVIAMANSIFLFFSFFFFFVCV